MLWSELERFGRFLDPWREFDRMSSALSRFAAPVAVEFPAFNLWVTGDHAVLTTEIPGVDPKDIEITAVGSTLTLRGSRDPGEVKGEESYHRRERWYGKFTKTFELPFPVEAGKIEARFSRGVLSVSLPRAEADKPKKIAVKID